MSNELKKRTVHGKEHALVVLLVTERDRFGRPAKATIGYDDTTFKIEGGEQFITAWVPVETIDAKRVS